MHILTLRVEKYLHLQQGTGEQLQNVLHPQQVKHFTDGKFKQRQLGCAWPLADDGPVYAGEFEGSPGRREGDLIEDVVNVALQWEGRGLGGRDGLVELLQHLPAGLREGHGRDQADALGHVQRVAADVVRVEALQARDGGRRVEHGTEVGVLVPLLFRSRRRDGGVQDVVLLCVVHVIKGLHCAADLLTGHLLKEGEGKAVSPRAVLPRDDEGVELRLPGINLRPESQTLRHTELSDDNNNFSKAETWVSMQRSCNNHTMPTASWSNGFHSTLSGKCARTLDLKVLRRGLCSKFSPETERRAETNQKKGGGKKAKLEALHNSKSR